MESTGVDGKPVYYLLEEDFTVLLVNEAHITNLPGRGRKKAIAAVAHSILCISHHMLSRQKPCSEPGAASLEKREKDRAVR